ncbi:EpsG family protein, partial [Vibrio breoganii]
MPINILYPLICSVYVIFIFPIFYFKWLYKNKFVSLTFLLVPIFITTATQVNIGTDYPSYIALYRGEFPFDASKGVIFNFLFDNLSLISDNPRSLFVMVSFLQCFFLFFIYKKIITTYGTEIFIFFLITYFCLTFTSSFNIFRSSLACMVLTYSFISYLPKKKHWKYCSSVLLATLFHPTAILFVFLPLFVNIFNKRISTVVLISIIVVGFWLGQARFISILAEWLYNVLPPGTPYRFYLISKHMNSYIVGMGLGMIINVMFCCVGVYFVRYEKRNDLVFFYNISIVVYSLGMVFYFNPIFNRVLYYFVFFQAFYLAILMSNLSRGRYLYS